MKKFLHLSSCNTCARIMKEINLGPEIELQDIKEQNISEKELDLIAEKSGGYEQVFSKRAMKFRSMGLNEMNLSEEDFKNHILNEYTFLKRPVLIVDDKVAFGNSKKSVAEMVSILNS